MLTLARREGESPILETSDGEIEVLVSETHRSSVKLSVDAPKLVTILRDELLEED